MRTGMRRDDWWDMWPILALSERFWKTAWSLGPVADRLPFARPIADCSSLR